MEPNDKPAPEPEHKRAPKSGLQVIAEFDYGVTHEQLTQAIQQATQATMTSGKPSRVTLVMDFSCDSVAQQRLGVLAEVATKLPKAKREAALVYLTQAGDVTTRNPRQMEIEGMRVVGAAPAPAFRVEGAEPSQPVVRAA